MSQKIKSPAPSLEAMRHSCEHVLHQAMDELFPGLKRAMGPATKDGFYFDFDPDYSSHQSYKISDSDFKRIEARMKKIIAANLPIVRQEISITKARKLFKGNPYKLDWIDQIEAKGEKTTVYWNGKPDQKDSSVDLCKGPHVQTTGQIGPFKLLSVAGAYWHGDEKNKMLTRIYGTCFPSQKDLDQFISQQKEAKKRDHRRLGKDLDLFSFHPAAPADIFWHPKGYTLMKNLFQYWRQIHERDDYLEVRTPVILSRQTWDQSGHTTFFIQKMYRVLTPDAKKWNMALKPMNCDGGILIYQSRPRSYKEFPLKMGELGVVHRFESSGETHGIIRPREFTQDDAHIYCTPKQVKDEIKKIIDLCFEVYQVFGLKLDHLELSTRPEKSIGSDEVWEKAETIMRQILKEKNIPHKINEGDGAFYGPKFDFHLKDAIGRTWQCSTIQLDFAQPENFQLEYTASNGQKERPVMIHRVLYGSVERFLGILIEHFAGAFPLWLSPLQVKIIPITDDQKNYAQKIKAKLFEEGIRVEIDSQSETMQAKIRQAQLEKVPYMLILGKREASSPDNQVSVRQRDGQDLGAIPLEKFINSIKKQIKEKSLNLTKI